MKINYKLSKKDYWNYNHFSVLHVKSIRRIFVGTPLTIFILTILSGIVFKLDMTICIIASIVIPCIYVASIYFPMAKGVMRIPDDKLVEQSLEINTEKKQIIHTFGSKNKKYNKTNIMQIKKNNNYIFITMQSFSAIIIPKSQEYDLNQVMNELNKIL